MKPLFPAGLLVPVVLSAHFTAVEASSYLAVLTSGGFLFSSYLLYRVERLKKERDQALGKRESDSKILFLQSRYASMGEMLGNIAHQWKQPLNAIGTIQNSIKAALIFQGEISKEKLLDSVETSFKLLQHLAETIDTFYGFLAQQHNENKSFLITDELSKIRKITEYSFENSRIRLHFELEADPTIQGNPNEFIHAMLNLIFNAKEAFEGRKTDTPTIIVRVEEGKNKCIIKVADNAGGIRITPIGMVFDLHFTTKEEGSGLGLFMTKNIVENRFGGTIDVCNVNGGACFTIELPYAEYGERIRDTFLPGKRLSLERINQLSRKIIELEEVEKTLQKWADIFKRARWGIALHIGISNRFEATNAAFNALYGYTSEELKKIDIEELFAPECVTNIPDIQKEAFEKGYGVFETLHKRKDGSLFPVIIELIVIKDEEGKILYHIANVWDMTEQKEAEERLLLKKFALDHIKDAVFLIDESGDFYYVNEGACRALGYSQEEFAGMNVGDIDSDWPKERWPEHWAILREVGNMTLELKHRRKDGSVFPVEVSTNYIEYKGRRYNMAIARDITERKVAEKDLLIIEKALNNTNEATYIMMGRYIVKVNEGACRMTGYTCDELELMTIFELDPDINEETLNRNISHMQINNRSLRFETRHRTKEGIFLDVEIDTSIFEYDGIIYSFSAVRDITEQKKVEETIRNLNVILERRVEERTIELQKALEFNEGIINAIPDMLFEIAPEGTYLNIWAQNQELLVAQKEMLIGKNFKDILPPDVVDISLQSMKEVDEKGFSLGNTYCLEFPDGKRWFELSVTKKESSGTYITLSRDITERKQAQEEIQKLNATLKKETQKQLRLLETAVNNVNDAIYIVADDHSITYVNDTATKMLGYTREEFLRMKVYDFDVCATLDELDAIRERINTLKNISFETRHRTKQGEILKVVISTTSFDYDHVSFRLAIVQNVTA